MKLEKRTLRLKRDWRGAIVKAKRDIANNGGERIRAGWIGKVSHNYGGLNIWFDMCKVCGTRMSVSHVLERDVEYLGHEVKDEENE